jgi:hypothetical protein
MTEIAKNGIDNDVSINPVDQLLIFLRSAVLIHNNMVTSRTLQHQFQVHVKIVQDSLRIFIEENSKVLKVHYIVTGYRRRHTNSGGIALFSIRTVEDVNLDAEKECLQEVIGCIINSVAYYCQKSGVSNTPYVTVSDKGPPITGYDVEQFQALTYIRNRHCLGIREHIIGQRLKQAETLAARERENLAHARIELAATNKRHERKKIILPSRMNRKGKIMPSSVAATKKKRTTAKPKESRTVTVRDIKGRHVDESIVSASPLLTIVKSEVEAVPFSGISSSVKCSAPQHQHQLFWKRKFSHPPELQQTTVKNQKKIIRKTCDPPKSQPLIGIYFKQHKKKFMQS